MANKSLTAIKNRMLDTAFSEPHTGYRAYSRTVLELFELQQEEGPVVRMVILEVGLRG